MKVVYLDGVKVELLKVVKEEKDYATWLAASAGIEGLTIIERKSDGHLFYDTNSALKLVQAFQPEMMDEALDAINDAKRKGGVL